MIPAELRPFSTVLSWYRMTRLEYHFNKIAHSIFIGTAVYCLLHRWLSLPTALIGAAVAYLVVGKVLYMVKTPRAEWTPLGPETMDWLADGLTGVGFAAVLVAWLGGSPVLDVLALALFAVGYAIPYFFALP